MAILEIHAGKRPNRAAMARKLLDSLSEEEQLMLAIMMKINKPAAREFVREKGFPPNVLASLLVIPRGADW